MLSYQQAAHRTSNVLLFGGDVEELCDAVGGLC